MLQIEAVFFELVVRKGVLLMSARKVAPAVLEAILRVFGYRRTIERRAGR